MARILQGFKRKMVSFGARIIKSGLGIFWGKSLEKLLLYYKGGLKQEYKAQNQGSFSINPTILNECRRTC